MQSQAAATARITMDRLNGRAEAALRLRANGRVAEALELLCGPGDYAQDVYTLRGDLQLELGQLHEAVGSYSTVIALDPENLYAHRNLATCFRRLERWGAAAGAFRKILDHDSYSDAARIGLGDCLLHLHQPEEALACFEACWSEAALLPALFGKAVALQLLRRFDASEALYLRFLELHPDSEEALCNLIALRMETFDLASVERYADQLVKHHSKSVVALQALILVAWERRSYGSAAEYYGRLLEAIPEEKLYQSGKDDALAYRLSPKNIELLNQVRRDLSQRTWRESH
jgi:tetratricopeptide (TPR) repeat protein